MPNPSFIIYSRDKGYSGLRVGQSRYIDGEAAIATHFLQKYSMLPYVGARVGPNASGKFCFDAGGRPHHVIDGDPCQKGHWGGGRLKSSDFVGSYVNEAPVGHSYNIQAIVLKRGDFIGINGIPDYVFSPQRQCRSVWYVLLNDVEKGVELFVPYGDTYDPIRRSEKYTPAAPVVSYGVAERVAAWLNETRILWFWTESLKLVRRGAQPPSIGLGSRVAFCSTLTVPNASVKDARYYVWRVAKVVGQVRRTDGVWRCRFEDGKKPPADKLRLSSSNFLSNPASVEKRPVIIKEAAGMWCVVKGS